MINCKDCEHVKITYKCGRHNIILADKPNTPYTPCLASDFKLRDTNTVSFCMRCFANSAVPVSEDTNFCHNCGSGGTCIAIKKDEAEYLRDTIDAAIQNVGKNLLRRGEK